MQTLTLATDTQKALYEYELRGQFSDGHWENSRPWEHYVPWCRAEVVVGPNVGRNFWAAKSSTDKRLLDVVSDRMLGIARLALVFGSDNLPQDVLWTIPCNDEGWSKTAPERIRAKGFDPSEVLAIVEGFDPRVASYGMRELRRDLNAIKAAMKVIVR